MKTGSNWVLVAVAPLLAVGCCTLNEPGDPCARGEATIFAAPAELRVKPECVEVEEGQTVTLRLVRPDGFRSDVETRAAPENKEATWLNAVSEGDTIRLRAPARGLAEGGRCTPEYCIYKYEIAVEGVGVLDPRVRVTHKQN